MVLALLGGEFGARLLRVIESQELRSPSHLLNIKSLFHSDSALEVAAATIGPIPREELLANFLMPAVAQMFSLTRCRRYRRRQGRS
jgi:hypothetical protein